MIIRLEIQNVCIVINIQLASFFKAILILLCMIFHNMLWKWDILSNTIRVNVVCNKILLQKQRRFLIWVSEHYEENANMLFKIQIAACCIHHQLNTKRHGKHDLLFMNRNCLLYTSPSPRDLSTSRMPSSA